MKDERTEGWVDELMDGWKDDGRTDRQIDR
jgi:hypothetical protein